MKKDIFIVVFILLSFYIFSENLLLKDGKIFKGELVYLDKEKITMRVDNELYDFNISLIEYLIVPSSQVAQRLIFIRKNDNTELSVNLIKLTEFVIYYNLITGNELMLTKLSDIKTISVLNSNINSKAQAKKFFLEKENNDINKDITEILIEIVKSKNILSEDIKKDIQLSSKNNSVIIDNPDFYDKFWIRISKYLEKNNENLLWGLIENYSEKEKFFNIFYNEKKDIDKYIIEEYRTKIIDLRKEFYKRAKKILLSEIKLF